MLSFIAALAAKVILVNGPVVAGPVIAGPMIWAAVKGLM